METRAFGTSGLKIPVLGLGCSPFGNRQRKISDEDVQDTVDAGFAIGANYFDVAPYYGLGLAERRLGQALLKRARPAFMVSTKVGRRLQYDPTVDITQLRNGFLSDEPYTPVFDYGYDGVMWTIEDSLNRMDLDHIDIIFVHDIGSYAHADRHDHYFREFIAGGYRALAELKAAGTIGAIGLGVNETAVCEQALDHGDFDGFLLAGRYTLLEQGGLDGLFPKCAARGTSIIVGGPYNSGLLAGGTRREGVLRYEYGIAPDHILARLKAIEGVCDAFAVPIASAALQMPLAHPVVSGVIPGLSSAARVQESLDLLNVQIPHAFWEALVTEGLVDQRAVTAQ